MMRLVAALAVCAALSGCAERGAAPERASGFRPAIECEGPFLTPEMDPRCGVYRRRLVD